MRAGSNVPLLTAARVRRIAGVSQRQLDYWDERGLVTASKTTHRGKGIERRYSYTDLIKVRVIKELRQTGLSLQKIQKALRALHKRYPGNKSAGVECLISDGRKVFRSTASGQLEDILAGGQLCFSVVFIDRIEAEVRKKLPDVELHKAAR